MDNDLAEAIALHRWAVIAEGANPRLSHAERVLDVSVEELSAATGDK